ncbi:hypothetical protein ACGFJ7_33890 [Actinoplanes sp. NPDC048988]|uniref:hypothetical protein n=1 Tax=Actinoplanes sp. NPDC048988 TaxID=3363901 RepID=UPI003719EA67
MTTLSHRPAALPVAVSRPWFWPVSLGCAALDLVVPRSTLTPQLVMVPVLFGIPAAGFAPAYVTAG